MENQEAISNVALLGANSAEAKQHTIRRWCEMAWTNEPSSHSYNWLQWYSSTHFWWKPMLTSLTFEMYFAGTVPWIPGDKITSLALWKKCTPSWQVRDISWNLVGWSWQIVFDFLGIQNRKWSSHLIQAKTELHWRQGMFPGWIISPRCCSHCVIRGFTRATHPNGRGQIDVDRHLS